MIATARPIPPCPTAGSGVHSWLMEAAWALRFHGESAEAAGRYLADNITRRPDPANEIESAIAKVYDKQIVQGAAGLAPPRPKWPEPNREAIEEIAASRYGLVDLWEASPIRIDDDFSTTAALEILFPGNPLVCVGNKTDFRTDHLSAILPTAHRLEQIVPSPMTSRYGRTQTGNLSQHSLQATGPRRFLVIEGDKLDGQPIPKDTQAAILLHLAESAPLTLVVDSGGKSLHGWFYVQGEPEDRLLSWFRRAVTLGADPALWTRNQFTRMPGGTRSNGNPQPVFFFNPDTITL